MQLHVKLREMFALAQTPPWPPSSTDSARSSSGAHAAVEQVADEPLESRHVERVALLQRRDHRREDPAQWRRKPAHLASLNQNAGLPVMSALVSDGHQNFSTCSITSSVPAK